MRTNRLALGDCVEFMEKLPDNSIDMVLTSPPYDHLFDLGLNWDFEATAEQLYRIIKPHQFVVWNVNDAVKDNCKSGTSFRQMVHFLDMGFTLHDCLILVRSHTRMVQHHRHGVIYEFAFVLTKGEPRLPNVLRDIPNRTHGKRKAPNTGVRSHCEIAEFGHRKTLWYFAVGGPHTSRDPDTDSHPGRMPYQIARDLILTFSKKGKLVFDPFSGVGTTCEQAMENGRQFIGVEIDARWHQIACNRLINARKKIA